MIAGMKELAGILVAAKAIGLFSLHSEGLNLIAEDGEPLGQKDLDNFCEQVGRRGIEANKVMVFSGT